MPKSLISCAVQLSYLLVFSNCPRKIASHPPAPARKPQQRCGAENRNLIIFAVGMTKAIIMIVPGLS
jgi:hypothetical protein